jgi:hypothetical protein
MGNQSQNTDLIFIQKNDQACSANIIQKIDQNSPNDSFLKTNQNSRVMINKKKTSFLD